jgi:hypothetical protein
MTNPTRSAIVDFFVIFLAVLAAEYVLAKINPTPAASR